MEDNGCCQLPTFKIYHAGQNNDTLQVNGEQMMTIMKYYIMGVNYPLAAKF